MIKVLLLSLFIVGCLSQKMVDTMNFNQEWKDGNKYNAVKLSFMAGSNCVEFLLTHPVIQTKNITSFVYLRNSSNTWDFIDSFKILPDTTTDPNVVRFYKKIPFEEIDNRTLYPCQRTVGISEDTITCSGFLTFIHKDDTSLDEAKNYNNTLNLGLVRYEFSLIVRVSKLVEGSVTTLVKTKVQDLPCVGCDCTRQCKVLQGFTSQSKFCTDSTCLTERNASEPYVFGDQGWIEITMTPATRRFEVWELYASSDGSEASPLSLSYLRVNNSQNGKVIIGIPMAGPASLVGLDFGLNFVLRALPSPGRFRMLQDSTPEATSVKTTRINVKEVTSPPIRDPPPANNTCTENCTKLNIPETGSTKGTITAVVVLGAITSLFAIIILIKSLSGGR